MSAVCYLKKKEIDALVVEASERWAGGKKTVHAADNGAPVEIGASRFAGKHTRLMRLLHEPDLPIFKQYQVSIRAFHA